MPFMNVLRYRVPGTIGALILVWLAIGLFGRDPWKPDEAYTVGLVYHIVRTGDWVVPTLAGEPFMEKPPLFFISAAWFAQAFDGLLALHDAARLATALYVGLTLVFVGLTARALLGPNRDFASVLILMGCVGYFHTAHLLVTDNALVAGVAIALYGLAIHANRPILAGIFLGTGGGIAFLAKGLLGPGMIGLTAIVLLALPQWRTRAYMVCLAVGAAALMPWAVTWPLLLYQRSPELFREWLFLNNFGRYMGTADLGPERDHVMYFKILPWFALPAWPLAAWSAWSAFRSRDAAEWQRITLPVVAVGVMLAALSFASNQRYLYALPMLVPLSILASAGFAAAPRWLAFGLYWLGVALGLAAALALWGGWAALVLNWPEPIANTLIGFRPGFTPSLQPTLIALAAAVTLLCSTMLVASRRTNAVPLAWLASTTLAWGIFFTLWLPFQEYGNSYRSMVAQITRRTPQTAMCMAYRGVGEPQRAALDYFGNILIIVESATAAKACSRLLVQTGSTDPLPMHGGEWIPVWSGARPGDVNERFWLFARAGTERNPVLQEVHLQTQDQNSERTGDQAK